MRKDWIFIILDSNGDPCKAFRDEGTAREAFVEFLESRLPPHGFGSWEYYADMHGFGKDVGEFKRAVTQYNDYDDNFDEELIAMEIED